MPKLDVKDDIVRHNAELVCNKCDKAITGNVYCTGCYAQNRIGKEKAFQRKFWRKHTDPTCSECGKNSEELQAKLTIHHLDYDTDDATQYDTDRAIPLCRECHDLIHHIERQKIKGE